MKQLWAPWRLEYIQGADEQDGCVFCRAAGLEDEEGLVVHRGEQAFVLLNRYPYAAGHLMVAGYRHGGDFGALDADEALEIHRLASTGLGVLAETISAGTWGGWPAPASSTTSTSTSSLAGRATRTSCPCSPT